jgi:hypothetical protein
VFKSVRLDDLRVIAVTGPDRAAFLQGQLTQDVAVARPDRSALAGWADPKGRLHFAGHFFAMAIGSDEALALLVPASTAPELLKRLRMYILRARVVATIAEVSVTGVLGAAGPDGPAPAGLRLAGPEERWLLLGEAPAAGGAVPCSRDEWQLAEIRAGQPVILPATSAEFVPQWVNLDLLGGISFTKGCYTGQEIVARMKYLGRVKRRMHRFAASASPPSPGAALHGPRGAAGQVVSSAAAPAGCEFLAVMILDDLAGPVFLDEAGTVPVTRLDLPYAIPA